MLLNNNNNNIKIFIHIPKDEQEKALWNYDTFLHPSDEFLIKIKFSQDFLLGSSPEDISTCICLIFTVKEDELLKIRVIYISAESKAAYTLLLMHTRVVNYSSAC